MPHLKGCLKHMNIANIIAELLNVLVFQVRTCTFSNSAHPPHPSDTNAGKRIHSYIPGSSRDRLVKSSAWNGSRTTSNLSRHTWERFRHVATIADVVCCARPRKSNALLDRLLHAFVPYYHNVRVVLRGPKSCIHNRDCDNYEQAIRIGLGPGGTSRYIITASSRLVPPRQR